MSGACEEAVKNEHAVEIIPGVYMFTGEVDQEKLAKVEASYAAAVYKLWEERERRRIEAMRELPGYILDY